MIEGYLLLDDDSDVCSHVSNEVEEVFSDEVDTDIDDIMSTIKKHLTSDAKHVLPTYKKLPPIQSPPPYSGLTIRKLNKSGNSPLGNASVSQVTSSNEKLVYDGTSILGQTNESSKGDVKLIGYRNLDEQKKSYIPPGSELPPCRICGEKASGLHYGVNTCEACKAFFRRTLKKSSVDFQCSCSPADRKRNLEDPPRKTSCPRCRYDRCINEGMSKDAIKIGRYTINRKRQNDREVNFLKEKGGVVGRRISESSQKSYSSVDSSPNAGSQGITSPEGMSPDTTTKSDGEDSNIGMATKRMKANNGQALAKGFMDTLHDSLYAKLLQDQNKSSPGTAGLTNLEKLYLQPFEPQSDPAGYKTTIQVGKTTPSVGPVSSSKPAVVQRGGKLGQSRSGQRVMGQQLPGKQPEVFQTVQNTTVTSSQQISPNAQLAFFVPQTSPLHNTTGQDGQTDGRTEGKSLIETLFEADGTVPIQSETSAIENLLIEPAVMTPSTLTQSQTAVAAHRSYESSQNVNPSVFLGKQITNTSISDNAMSDIINGEDLFSADPMNIPLETINDREIASKLKSMQELENEGEESLDSFAANFNLRDEEIASKLKSMENHSLENDALIASKLKSLEAQDLESDALIASKLTNSQQHELDGTNQFAHLNGNLHANESNVIANKLDIYSRQHDEECEKQYQTSTGSGSPMLSSVDLAEYEIHQPQTGSPKVLKLPTTMSEMKAACNEMVDTAMASYVSPLRLSCEEIKKRHKAYLEEYILKTQVFGNMNNIPEKEYMEFYNQTGIDIDNRQQILIEYLQYAEQGISELVTFSKVIPGFTSLPLDDQVTLLKAARFSTVMIKDGMYGGQCKATAYSVATTPWNKDYHFDELKKIAPGAMFEMKASVYEKVYEVGMTVEESIIVKAVAITYPKHPDLIEPDKVEAIHNNLTECLVHVLQMRKMGEKKPSLTSIFELLFYLRDKSAQEHQFMVEMFEKWPLTNNHQLLKEFVS